jgi:HAD superfamily hydrolase (TIGR01484 family)
MANIKAIIMDVDGVIVGKTQGVNFPLPNKKIITVLKDLQKKNIPVVLCTAKFSHAIKEIIFQANLRNPHITDGGALVIDPLDNKIVKKHVLDNKLVKELVEKCIAHGFYTELFGVDEYYLQKNQISEFTEKRIRILQKEHKGVDSLIEKIDTIEVIKMINFAHTDADKMEIDKLLTPFKDRIHYIWSLHPSLLPSIHTVVTVKGVSKKLASLEVLNSMRISPDETLGIGDTMGDWKFMSLCKYAGVVGDASQELNDLAKTKKEGNYFFASSVEEDGFLQILDYFIS